MELERLGDRVGGTDILLAGAGAEADADKVTITRRLLGRAEAFVAKYVLIVTIPVVAAVSIQHPGGGMLEFLITAGPTREYLDDVRFLSNASSGRMGFALAQAALDLGHAVHLVIGPVESNPPAGVKMVQVVSALDMQAAAERIFPRCQIAIAAAAVADYRPVQRVAGKPGKGAAQTIELVPNPDIVAGLAARRHAGQVVVGFALQATRDGAAEAGRRARAKLAQKRLDLIALNLDSALGQASSEVELLYADGRQRALPAQDKSISAAQIVAAAIELWRQRNGGPTEGS